MDREVQQQEAEIINPIQSEVFDDMDVSDIVPSMNVNANVVASENQEEKCIVGDDVLLNLFDEILKNCRDDRKQIDEVLLNFVNMVMNDGDGSNSSKEAIVNLIKTKSDVNDKMAKVGDLMTRIKLKDKDTFPRYLAANQNNTINIESGKREMLKKIISRAKESNGKKN